MLHTAHSVKRQRTRGISDAQIRAAFLFGRRVEELSATIYTISMREVQAARYHGADISDCLGIRVICDARNAAPGMPQKIKTVIRSNNYRRGNQ